MTEVERPAFTLKWVGEGKEERVDTDDLRIVDCLDLMMGLAKKGGLYRFDDGIGVACKKGREERVITDGNADDNKQDRHGRNEPGD